MTKPVSQPIMGVPQVAKYLGVSEMTIYRYAKVGKIPAFKVGAKWRFHRKSIDNWIAEKERYNVAGKDRRRSQLTLFDQKK